jgi:hypothetical protein
MVVFPKKVYLGIYGFVLASVVIGFIIMMVLFAKANYIAVTTKPFQCLVLQKLHSDVPCRQGPDPGVCDLLTYRVEFPWRDNVTLTAHIDITQGHTISTRDPHYLVGETHQCLVQVKSGLAVAAYWSLPEHLEAYRNASLVMGVVVFLVILVSVGAIVFINMRDRMGDEARSLLADTKSPAISVA